MGNYATLTIVYKDSGTLYFGDAMYCTSNSDTPANTLFHEKIRELEYERALTYPWWSRSGVTSPVRYIDYVNTDGYFDSMVADEWRDTFIEIYKVQKGLSFAYATLVGSFFVENITLPDVNTFRVNGYSVAEQLDKELTTTFPSTVTNTQYRNQAKPITLGHVRWSYPINTRLNDASGSARGFFDVADDYFERIDTVLFRGAAANETTTDYTGTNEYFVMQNSDTYGENGFGFRSHGTDYRIAAEVYGQLRKEATIIVSGDFPADDGFGYPVDFVSDVGSGFFGTITWSSAGVIGISSSGVEDIFIGQTLTLTTGALYMLEATFISGSGTWSMFNGATAIRSVDAATGGRHCCVFTCNGADYDVRLGFVTGASGSCSFSAFQCYPVHRIDKLSEFMRFIAARTGVSNASLNLTAAAYYEALDNVRINFASTTEITGGVLLRKAAESYGCTFYQNNAGQLTPVMFSAPNVSEDYVLYEINVAGEVEFEPDFAPGLSNRLRYDYNYNVHGEDDVLGVSSSTTAGVQLREDLRHDFRVVVSTETLHTMYADAEEREPLESLVEDEASAQALIDRVCGLYTTARAFYSFRAFVTDMDPYTIEPGMTVRLYYGRYGLSAGKNLLVVYVKSSFGRNFLDLVLWG